MKFRAAAKGKFLLEPSPKNINPMLKKRFFFKWRISYDTLTIIDKKIRNFSINIKLWTETNFQVFQTVGSFSWRGSLKKWPLETQWRFSCFWAKTVHFKKCTPICIMTFHVWISRVSQPSHFPLPKVNKKSFLMKSLVIFDLIIADVNKKLKKERVVTDNNSNQS